MTSNKIVYLLRHAKSSWKDANITDKQRPLNKRGIRNLGEMGQRIAAQEYRPDLVISSPAKRALITACGIADAIGYPSGGIRIEDDLYFGGVGRQLELLSHLDATLQSVMLVGHNPDMSSLLHVLTGAEEDMPTCAFAVVELNCQDWLSVTATQGQLALYQYPNNSSG